MRRESTTGRPSPIDTIGSAARGATRALLFIVGVVLVAASCSQAQATPAAGQATASPTSLASSMAASLGASSPAASTAPATSPTATPWFTPVPTPSPRATPTPVPPTPTPTNAATAGGTLPGGSGCPKKLVHFEDVTNVPVDQRAVCFGSVTLTLVAFAPTVDMDVAACPPDPSLEPDDCTAKPAWLIGASWVIAGDMAGDGTAPNTLVVAVEPESGVIPPGDAGWLRVAGHFDDPASSSCRITVDRTGKLAQPAKTTVARCRSTFVATSIKRLPGT